MAISIVGCAQNTFFIETNDGNVLPNKVHYKQNERAKITISKTKESDIIEPIALVEFRNTNNKVVEKIENFSSLESNNNEFIYYINVKENLKIHVKYYFKDVKKGIVFDDKIYYNFDYNIILTSNFSSESFIKLKKHKAIPYSINKKFEIIFYLNSIQAIELQDLYVNGKNIFKEEKSDKFSARIFSQRNTGFKEFQEIELSIEIETNSETDMLYTISIEP